MKILASSTAGVWLPLNVERADGEEDSSLPTSGEAFRSAFSDLLTSNNLIVLSGLGTSLCVRDDGKSRAPTMAVLWNEIHSHVDSFGTEGEWERVLNHARYSAGGENIEELLSSLKTASTFEQGNEKKEIDDFISTAETIIRRLVNFLKPTDRLDLHQAFLRRVARRSPRRNRLKLFTTNYDRCFEHAAHHSGFVVVDGFSFSEPRRFDPTHYTFDIVRRHDAKTSPDYIDNLFHLYKLHGSIDWEYDEEDNSVIKRVGTNSPLLIYPRNNKYELTFSQPYLEMMSSFQTALRDRDVALLIVGFGFNDNHISEPILSAIEQNLSMRLIVVSPGLEAQSDSNSYIKRLATLIRNGDSRVALAAMSFEQIVPRIPDVLARTELERHYERVQASRNN